MDETKKRNPPNRKRPKKICAFLYEEEYDILKKKCEYTGVSISAYMRQMIRNGVIVTYEPFAIKDVCFELNKIGTNINQIAKKVNENGMASETDFKKLKKEYEELFNLYITKVIGVE